MNRKSLLWLAVIALAVVVFAWFAGWTVGSDIAERDNRMESGA